jgi:hypothetical protein
MPILFFEVVLLDECPSVQKFHGKVWSSSGAGGVMRSERTGGWRGEEGPKTKLQTFDMMDRQRTYQRCKTKKLESE